ncbi:MAG TPA: alpha/beta hydrolase [Paludibacteraceae bacterium]|mgnify:FL=1|jgi:poly(3-hydroxybutyrate) depolymerase|nr:alpha/beta hydrolase [Paludibacteraceae bacterium]HPH63609.1 alpha/beta hydrolase [Paludibacteraceae bacterium]HQF50057.1 alpha/beta hydrolase [Paludibacteraceae bacterium]
MKHLYIFLFTLFVSLAATAEPIFQYSITVDGLNREYSLILPPGFVESEKYPLLIFLHPNGSEVEGFIDTFKLEEVAKNTNSIVVVPQAWDEQNTDIIGLFSQLNTYDISYPGMSLKHVWGAGASISTDVITSKLAAINPLLVALFPSVYPDIAASGKIVFNQNVDDVNFINKMIEQIEDSYVIDTDKVFMLGASMGGAMTYKYAYSSESKIKGAVVISGFIGNEVKPTNMALNIPLFVIHSESDSVVDYNGGMLSASIPSIVESIAKAQGCEDAAVTDIPNVADDGFLIKSTSYDCDSTKRVLFYSIDKSTHADFLVSNYETGPNDIDYYIESYNFLFGKRINNKVEEIVPNNDFIYPNPTIDHLYVCQSGEYKFFSLDGSVIKQGNVENGVISVGDLNTGLYVFVLENEDGRFLTKISKQ